MSGTKFQTINRCILFYDLETRIREDSKFQKMEHIIFQFQKYRTECHGSQQPYMS